MVPAAGEYITSYHFEDFEDGLEKPPAPKLTTVRKLNMMVGHSNSSERELFLEAEERLLDWGLEYWFTASTGYLGKRVKLDIKICDVEVTFPDPSNSNHDDQELCTGHVHTVEYSRINAPADTAQNPIVMLHGFGAGIGNYYAVLPALANSWEEHIYAIDMFGCGLSSRPTWKAGYGEDIDVSFVESFFIDALESWRKAQNIEKMVLLGHSLGGYLSVAYSEKYPERVERLILCSPVGLLEKPKTNIESVPLWYRPVKYLWRKGWSPFHVVRSRAGKTLVDIYAERRFDSKAPWINKQLLKRYMYFNFTSGEISGGGVSHATLLQPGENFAVYARRPLHSRLVTLSNSVEAVSFVYGTHDWMDVSHAEQIRDNSLNADNNGQSLFSVFQVWNSGHNMFIDNPLGFVDSVLLAANLDPNLSSNTTQVLGHNYDTMNRGFVDNFLVVSNEQVLSELEDEM